MMRLCLTLVAVTTADLAQPKGGLQVQGFKSFSHLTQSQNRILLWVLCTITAAHCFGLPTQQVRPGTGALGGATMLNQHRHLAATPVDTQRVVIRHRLRSSTITIPPPLRWPIYNMPSEKASLSSLRWVYSSHIIHGMCHRNLPIFTSKTRSRCRI